MTYDPHKRESSWTMIQPGCYVDPAGMAHLFPDEVVAELDRLFPHAGFDACSQDDYELVVRMFTEQFRRDHPGLEIRFVEHERQAS